MQSSLHETALLDVLEATESRTSAGKYTVLSLISGAINNQLKIQPSPRLEEIRSTIQQMLKQIDIEDPVAV